MASSSKYGSFIRNSQPVYPGAFNVSIYNHQLCVLERDLWPVARKSISDWKNEYLACCDECAVQGSCGGFFSSSQLKHSDHIRPIRAEDSCDTACLHPQFNHLTERATEK